jgi:NSS family neurotransmitter:Na+ symporter
MPAGMLAAFAFYALLIAAALASAISMLELVVAPLTRCGWSRVQAAVLSALTAWVLGLATVLSFNLWSAWHPLAMVPGLAKANWFEALDYVTSNVMLPAAVFLLAVFAGWIMPDRLLSEEIGIGPTTLAFLRMMLRYIIPSGIAAVVVAPYFI